MSKKQPIMKAIQTTYWGGAQAIPEAELHQHTCGHCGHDFGCEGESCKPSDTQVCEECQHLKALSV